MSLRSMTGFGVASRAWDDASADARHTVHVEIRSVNARFRELKVRQPFGPRIEHEIRRQVEAVVGRGRVEVGVSLRSTGGEAARGEGGSQALAHVGLQAQQVHDLVSAVREAEWIAGREGLELGPPNAVEMFRFCTGQRTQAGPDPATVPAFLPALVEEALQALSGLRTREGEALCRELERLIDQLAGHLERLRQTLHGEESHVVAKLRQRLATLCATANVPVPEQARIQQEVALLLVRGDVTEELARLDSHLSQMRQLLQADAEVGDGKTLDFLCQELFREISTIGSKINSLEGSATVIDLKRIVEGIREQVQNVE